MSIGQFVSFVCFNCLLTNIMGHDPPILNFQSALINYGSRIKMTCTFRSELTDWGWIISDVPHGKDKIKNKTYFPRYDITETRKGSSRGIVLTLNNVTWQDQTTYECYTLVNRSIATSNVYEPKVAHMRRPPKIDLLYVNGSKAAFICRTTGWPIPKISWFGNYSPILHNVSEGFPVFQYTTEGGDLPRSTVQRNSTITTTSDMFDTTGGLKISCTVSIHGYPTNLNNTDTIDTRVVKLEQTDTEIQSHKLQCSTSNRTSRIYMLWSPNDDKSEGQPALRKSCVQIGVACHSGSAGKISNPNRSFTYPRHGPEPVIHAMEGETIVMSCRYSEEYKVREVRWLHNNSPMNFNNTNGELHVHLMENSFGLYSCNVDVTSLERKLRGNIVLINKKPIVQKLQYSHLSTSIVLSCITKCSFSCWIQWIHPLIGKISPGRKTSKDYIQQYFDRGVEKISYLILPDYDQEKIVGTFECFVFNEYGSDRSTIAVKTTETEDVPFRRTGSPDTQYAPGLLWVIVGTITLGIYIMSVTSAFHLGLRIQTQTREFSIGYDKVSDKISVSAEYLLPSIENQEFDSFTREAKNSASIHCNDADEQLYANNSRGKLPYQYKVIYDEPNFYALPEF